MADLDCAETSGKANKNMGTGGAVRGLVMRSAMGSVTERFDFYCRFSEECEHKGQVVGGRGGRRAGTTRSARRVRERRSPVSKHDRVASPANLLNTKQNKTKPRLETKLKPRAPL